MRSKKRHRWKFFCCHKIMWKLHDVKTVMPALLHRCSCIGSTIYLLYRYKHTRKIIDLCIRRQPSKLNCVGWKGSWDELADWSMARETLQTWLWRQRCRICACWVSWALAFLLIFFFSFLLLLLFLLRKILSNAKDTSKQKIITRNLCYTDSIL